MGRATDMLDSIQFVLDGVTRDRDAVIETARKVSAISREVHALVSRCVELARAGHAVEAESAMRAFREFAELTTALCGDRLGTWAKFCKANNLHAPAQLSIDQVSELNESLAHVEAMQAALARYRCQNLALESARIRLKTLRLLAARDPNNPLWQQDVTAFEGAALQEMLSDFDQCIQSESLHDEAWAICTELSAGKWLHPDARVAATRMSNKLKTLAVESAAARARKLFEELYADYMAEDVASATARVSEWKALEFFLSDSPIKISNEIAEGVQRVIDWVAAREGEERQARAETARIDDLAALVERPDADLAALSQGLRVVERNRQGCPADLRRVAEDRIHRLQSAQKRKRALIAGGIAVGVLAVAAAVTLMVRGVLRDAKSGEWSASITQDIANMELERAGAALQEALAADPDSIHLAEVGVALEEARSKEKKRQIQFGALLSGAGDPAAESARADRASAAERLARTDQEHEDVREWNAAHLLAEAARQATIDGEYLQKLEEVGGLVQQLQDINPLSEDALRRIGQAEEILRLANSAVGVSADARGSTVVLQERIAKIRGGVEMARDAAGREAMLQEDLKACARSVSDPVKFAARLRRFAADHPEAIVAADFTSVASQEGCWSAVASWSTLAKGWQSEPFPVAPKARQKRAETVAAFLKDLAGSPVNAPAQAYMEALTEGSAWHQAMSGLLNQWAPMSYQRVRLNDGRVFYYDPNSAPTDSTIGGQKTRVYEVHVSLSDPKLRFEKVDARQVAADGASPQAELREALLPLVKGLSADSSIPTALQTMERIQRAEAVDPAIRAYVLLSIAESLAKDCPPLTERLTALVEELQRAEPDQIDWVVDSDPAKRRGTAELGSMIATALSAPELAQLRQRANEAAAKVLFISVTPVAMLVGGESGPSVVSGGGHLTVGETLYAMPLVDGACTMQKIGKVGPNGVAELNGAEGGLPQGTPVWSGLVP